jgi:hypothetical protein
MSRGKHTLKTSRVARGLPAAKENNSHFIWRNPARPEFVWDFSAKANNEYTEFIVTPCQDTGEGRVSLVAKSRCANRHYSYQLNKNQIEKLCSMIIDPAKYCPSGDLPKPQIVLNKVERFLCLRACEIIHCIGKRVINIVMRLVMV